MSPKLFLSLPLVGLCLALVASPARAEEGMWTYNNPPLRMLRERYRFTPTPEWFHHLMRSSVRFNTGGSGSFVSSNGLVMTNHHVAAPTLDRMSSATRPLLRTGFHARTQEEEIRADDLELNVLQSIEDVTDEVNAAITSQMTAGEQFLARRAVIARIEQRSDRATGLRSNVVTLYQGGQYHLYRFKRYTDVRLVFAPEKSIAFFGGDPDNFEYPRYDLDMAFFRVYEDGKPVKVEHYLQWSPEGPQENEMTIVSGHPGNTSRMFTVAALEYMRDHNVPFMLDRLRRVERSLVAFGAQGAEHARRAEATLFSVQNSRTVTLGHERALRRAAFLEQRRREEAQLRAAVAARPDLHQYLDAWDTIARTRARMQELYLPYNFSEGALGLGTQLFGFARTLVRLADENGKEETERLPEFTTARRPELELSLFSPSPIYADLEEAKLVNSLTFLLDRLGAEHELVRSILRGQSPAARAAQLVRETGLASVETRRALAAGGAVAIAASTDPMIQLARAIDEVSRRLRRTVETEIAEPEKQAYAKIARAQFALFGTDRYPDATFTLRLSFGRASGYTQRDGVRIPWATTLGGAFEHEREHGARDPWQLPASWHAARTRMNLDTPFNFVTTNDIIGGNSGSPVVNRRGQVVGLVFDGNKPSLVSNYTFDEEEGRAVSVASSGILESLLSVYEADALVKELLGGCAYDVMQP